jgi:hypothetical protein
VNFTQKFLRVKSTEFPRDEIYRISSLFLLRFQETLEGSSAYSSWNMEKCGITTFAQLFFCTVSLNFQDAPPGSKNCFDTLMCNYFRLPTPDQKKLSN